MNNGKCEIKEKENENEMKSLNMNMPRQKRSKKYQKIICQSVLTIN